MPASTKPSLDEFENLMKQTDVILNEDALERPDYYKSRGGLPLEDDVKTALDRASIGTSFEGQIKKVSGRNFPDILVGECYGVEVKSTKENKWSSLGSSILESSRLPNVKRIYMTFGKLGGEPIEFRSRPYESCLYEIGVTHMPRYTINADLPEGETIFDKMGVSYDELRTMDDPIAPVAKYYRSKLEPGERLWWAGDALEEEAVSAVIRLWKNISQEERAKYTTYALVNFPEVFSGNYDRYSVWLTTKGIADPHIRDQFSAGGKEEMLLSSGEVQKFPAVFRRPKKFRKFLVRQVAQTDSSAFGGMPVLERAELKSRLLDWVLDVSDNTKEDSELVKDALNTMLFKAPQDAVLEQDEDVQLCPHCGEQYIQKIEVQTLGFKEKDYDICPYCGEVNAASMETEFHNRKE